MSDLNEMSVSELTALYNSKVAADKQIKKFSTKADGVRRVAALLAEEESKGPKVEEVAATSTEAQAGATSDTAAKAKGPKRIELIMEILTHRPYGITELAEIYNTTPRVISNDLCDIRKQLPEGQVLKREFKAYTIQPAA